MIATFFGIDADKRSISPRVRLEIELKNDSDTNVEWIYGWTGELRLDDNNLLVGNLSTTFRLFILQPKEATKVLAHCEISPDKLAVIEDTRSGANLRVIIIINLLRALIQNTVRAPFGIELLSSTELTVNSSAGQSPINIPRSTWDDILEEMCYGKILSLRLAFPASPLDARVVKAIGFLEAAQKKINDGEWSDALVSCRKSIEEMQKLMGKSDEERNTFFQNILQDEKKASDCDNLWEAVQKAKNFASGGPHTYWVKAADRRDAELAIRVTSAFVHYIACNLARASGT